MKRLIATVALAAAVLTALLSGTVSAAHANSISRANAVRAAKDYLHSQGFSFKGLVEQLEYEGYSASDSRYGASHSGANWYKQAARVAKDYLRSQPFSRRSLIEQLEYEGFTYAQALYGVRAAGL
jgi:Host cell surface-exposed lipoprotein